MNNGIIKGTLIRNEKGVWLVKWSDLHSFGHGTHWSYTELSSCSNSIKYIENNEIKYKPLKEDLEVNFKPNFNFLYAILVFPEVEDFEKEQFIKEYVIKNNILFSIDDITTMRDGGTIVMYGNGRKQKTFYIHKDNWTLHDGYPTTDDNKVIDKPTQVYTLDRLEKYKRDCEFDLTQVKNIIEKIKL